MLITFYSPPPKLAVRTVAKSASNESSDDWDSPQPIPKIPQQSESSDDWDAPKVQAPKINLPTQSTEAGKGDGSSSDWDSPRKRTLFESPHPHLPLPKLIAFARLPQLRVSCVSSSNQFFWLDFDSGCSICSFSILGCFIQTIKRYFIRR